MIEAFEELARRRRLQIGPSRLAAFVDRLGLPEEVEVEGSAGGESDTTLRFVARAATSPPSGAPASERPSPTRYRIKRGDGTQIGPVALAQLIELFATGQVGTTCSIAREPGRFKPVTRYPELARFVSSPALQWDVALPADAIDRGLLDPARLPTRIFHMAVRRETGVL